VAIPIIAKPQASEWCVGLLMVAVMKVALLLYQFPLGLSKLRQPLGLGLPKRGVKIVCKRTKIIKDGRRK
jgi:hypothetical protein